METGVGLTARPVAASPARPAIAPSTSVPWWRGRRGVLARGGVLVVLGLVVLAGLPSGSALVPAGPLAPLAAPPAQLEVDLEHTLKSGTLCVWVDDDLALEEPLESYVSDDLVLLKLRKGRER